MASLFGAPPSPFIAPSLFHRILSSPVKFVTQYLHTAILSLRGFALTIATSSPAVRIVCISDTHTQIPSSLPSGDLLIHAGDLTNAGTVDEIQHQIDWLSSSIYEHVIVVAGNHDSYFDPRSRRKTDLGKDIRWGNVHYLQHSSLKLDFHQGRRQLSFYGAPQIPKCGGKEFAFQYDRDCDAWTGTIPVDIDVLITHTPPRHHLDLPIGMGCDFLLSEVWRVKPRAHIFGHVHAGHGRERVFWDKSQRIFEKICARGEKGVLMDLLAVGAWMDVLRLAIYGLLGIIWSRVWGGESRATLMVNAALTYESTGRLENPAQVIEI